MMETKVLKNKLFNQFNDKPLMEWEVFKYPENEEKPLERTIVEFGGKIIDDAFADTFSFFSSDDSKFVWMFDTEQKISERQKTKEPDSEGIIGGPTVDTFETLEEAEQYMVYVYEAIQSAGFYFAESYAKAQIKA